MGRLTLGGASTFAGGLTVSAGTLRVTNLTGSATGSGDVEVFSGAMLTGSGVIGSATTIDDGATLAPGDALGTLTFASSLTLNDNSLLPFALGTNGDSVVVSGNLNLTGRLSITNAGGFGPGTYTLFTCGGALTLGNLVLVSAPAGYNYTFNTTTPGVVKLVVASPTPPGFAAISINGGNLVFSGGGGVPNANFILLGSSNLSTPLNNWTPLATNPFDAGGNFSITNSTDSNQPQTFYLLKVP